MWEMLQLQHQEYVLAPYLSALTNFRSHTDLSAESGVVCHGRHVDTGNFKPVGQKVDREQRSCLVCGSDAAEDEHHFVTALHIVQSGLIYCHFLGTSPWSCMNVLRTGLCC